jgi:mono/diheme cytochrome c family protein
MTPTFQHRVTIPGTAPLLALVGAVSILLAACEPQAPAPVEAAATEPHVMAASTIEAGRYLITVAGCNDCHTDGYLQTGGQVPEEAWLAGSPVGWRGPWGTTYASNLRLRAQEWTEEQWVETLHSRTGLPPMPWMNVSQMSASDARAMYQYIRSLGPTGEHMPLPVPPDAEPETPYISLQPLNLGSVAPEDASAPAGS